MDMPILDDQTKTQASNQKSITKPITPDKTRHRLKNKRSRNKCNTQSDEEPPEYLQISKINKYIYIGSYKHPKENTDEFKKLEIDVIFNCAREINYETDSKYIIEHIRLEDDYKNASLLEFMDDANNKLYKYLKEGKKIYLHCSTGTSRAPAILIYYLMSHKGFTYERALSLLQNIRPCIEINENFERELLIIEED